MRFVLYGTVIHFMVLLYTLRFTVFISLTFQAYRDKDNNASKQNARENKKMNPAKMCVCFFLRRFEKLFIISHILCYV